MLDAIGEIYRAQSFVSTGAHAGYRGQIGRNSALPHALAGNLVFERGDVLVTGASAPVWGYLSELERTMVLGEPTPEQERMFAHMVALQDVAFAAIRPGRPCSEVDGAVRAYFDEHDLGSHWRHHTGHAIALRYHEGPFLDSAITRRSGRAWCSPSSQASTHRSSAAFATRTPSSPRTTEPRP